MEQLSREELRKKLYEIIGPPSRELSGDEYNRVRVMLQLLEPVNVSNNQHTWTEEYLLAGKKYNVIYGISDNPIIEEIESLD